MDTSRVQPLAPLSWPQLEDNRRTMKSRDIYLETPCGSVKVPGSPRCRDSGARLGARLRRCLPSSGPRIRRASGGRASSLARRGCGNRDLDVVQELLWGPWLSSVCRHQPLPKVRSGLQIADHQIPTPGRFRRPGVWILHWAMADAELFPPPPCLKSDPAMAGTAWDPVSQQRGIRSNFS